MFTVEKYNRSKCREELILGSSRPIDTSTASAVHKTQETWMKKGQKKCKSQRTRKSVGLFLLEMTGKLRL